MGLSNHEVQRRANAYARQVVDGELERKPLAERLVAKLHPDYHRAITHVARAFAIGFAAGVEDASTPHRTVRK